MAAFIYSEGDGSYITLRAEVGEEIPTDMAVAWAAIGIAQNLDSIADRIMGVDNSLNRIADVLTDIPSR